MQSTAKQNYPDSVASYNTRSGKRDGLILQCCSVQKLPPNCKEHIQCIDDLIRDD